jgi:hypothetical protein
MLLNEAVFGATALLGVMVCWGEKLEEVLDPLLPGSEQFKLQQRRAMETLGLLLADWACLQQSGILAIEPSPSCAPTPTAPPSMAATRVKTVSQWRIDVRNNIASFVHCQANQQHGIRSTSNQGKILFGAASRVSGADGRA